MTAEAFIGAFAAAFAEAEAQSPDLIEKYRQSKTWTPFMLDENPTGLLRTVAHKWAAASGYEAAAVSLHGQWYTLDLCMVTPAYVAPGDYWRSKTILTIEHENDADVETEMWKLAHWRSDLSVLVFYDFSEAECATGQLCGDRLLPGVAKRDWLTRKIGRLSEIVRHIDQRDSVRHLLLIGQRSAGEMARIGWRCSTWVDDSFSVPSAVLDKQAL